MGTFISCHKTTKVSAQTVSTQATDRIISLRPSDCITGSVKDDQDVQKTVVTELNIGDGDLTNVECVQHEYPVSIRSNKENKSRRGVHRLKSAERTEHSTETGIGRSQQCNYALLPGQVSPKDGTPTLMPRAENVDRSGDALWSYYDTPKDTKGTILTAESDETNKTHQQNLSSTDPRASRVDKSPDISTVNKRESYEDENSNVVQAGTAKQSLHRQLNKTNPDDEAPPKQDHFVAVSQQAKSRLSVFGCDSRYPRWNTSPPWQKPTIPRSHERPPYSRNPRKNRMLLDQGSDFQYSLEEIFQRNVPCNDELLEPAAMTGMPSFRLPQASCETYPVSFELKVMMREGAAGDYGSTPHQMAPVNWEHKTNVEEPRFGGGGGGGGRTGEKDEQDNDGDRLQRQEGSQHAQGYNNRALESSTNSAGLRPLGTGDVNSTDQLVTSSLANTSERRKVEQCNNTHPADGQSEEAAKPVQPISSQSTLVDSPDASDGGSSKSTISTDVDNSHAVLEVKVKQSVKQSSLKDADGSVEPVFGTMRRDSSVREETLNHRSHAANDGKEHSTDQSSKKCTEQLEEVTKEKNPSRLALDNTDNMGGNERITYRAIQEAVNMAILKLQSMEAGDLGQHLGESDMSMDKDYKCEDATVALDRTVKASPEAACHLQQRSERRNVTFHSIESCVEHQPRVSQAVSEDNSVACPPAEGTHEGKAPCNPCMKEEITDNAQPTEAQDHRLSTTDSTDTTIQKEDEPIRENSDIIPLHRVLGQTNLCVSPASQALPGMHLPTSRSLPSSVGPPIIGKEPAQIRREATLNTLPEGQMLNMALGKGPWISHEELQSAGAETGESRCEGVHVLTSRSLPTSVSSPFTGKEPNQIQTEANPNTLPEDQMLSIAISKNQRVLAESHKEQQLPGAEDGGSHFEGSEQLLPSKEKICPPDVSQKQNRLSNRGFPGKSPRRRTMTTHEHLHLSEDVVQNWGTSSPAHQPASSPQIDASLSPACSEAHSLLPGGHDDTEESVRSARSVPRDPDSPRR